MSKPSDAMKRNAKKNKGFICTIIIDPRFTTTCDPKITSVFVLDTSQAQRLLDLHNEFAKELGHLEEAGK